VLIRSWCNRDHAEPHLELLGAVIVAARKLRQLPLKMSQRNSRRQSTTGQPAVPQNPLEEVPQYEDMIAQYEDMIAQLEDRIVQLEEEHSNEIEELNLDLADERTRLREAMEDVTQFSKIRLPYEAKVQLLLMVRSTSKRVSFVLLSDSRDALMVNLYQKVPAYEVRQRIEQFSPDLLVLLPSQSTAPLLRHHFSFLPIRQLFPL
jgi:hypothetical protein